MTKENAETTGASLIVHVKYIHTVFHNNIHKVTSRFVAGDILKLSLLFFRENKTLHVICMHLLDR